VPDLIDGLLSSTGRKILWRIRIESDDRAAIDLLYGVLYPELRDVELNLGAYVGEVVHQLDNDSAAEAADL
jgi:hypothetical protein